MIIPLTLPSGPSGSTLPPALAQLGSSELFLLELQGDLVLSGDKRGQLVGQLTIDETGTGKPTLRIGCHLLQGTIVSLPKPLAVLQRVRAPSPSPSPSQMPPTPRADADEDIDVDVDVDMRRGDEEPPRAPSTSYTIRSIVCKKIVFSKRPTPIVGSSSSARIGVVGTTGSP